MSKDSTTTEFLMRLKQDLVDFVNSTMDTALRSLETSNGEVISIDVPIVGHTGFMKGKKPLAVILSNGDEVETPKWKTVVQAILQDCIKSAEKYDTLMSLRGKISGRDRVILSATPEDMDSPILIAEGLYLESKFDTETLLNVLLDRVLKPVGYNASGISVRIKI